MASHEHWMALALQQARRGIYSTDPNPRVGCVITRADELVASGFHQYAGGPHAEINALQALQGDAADCTVYVTLEPCSHHGRTPPCANALVEAAPSRVVVAMQDPNPQVAGRGIQRLRDAGIDVVVGVLESQANELNRGFVQRMQRQRPWLRVKMASSLDGRSALANGVSQWITSEAARHDVQRLRAQAGAVLSTAQTVIADNASLNARLDPGDRQLRQPVRVILDRQGQLTGNEALFTIASPIWVVTGEHTPRPDYANLDYVELLSVADDGVHFDLSELMHELARREINEVHSECGANLAGALIKAGLVDELVLYQAPTLLGSAARGLFDLGEISIMSDRIDLRVKDVRQIGPDIRITATPEY